MYMGRGIQTLLIAYWIVLLLILMRKNHPKERNWLLEQAQQIWKDNSDLYSESLLV